jgi:pullulanase/glycogen debranching enzyme
VGFSIDAGRSFPLGATVYSEGVNCSIFSKGATGVELLLLGEMDAPQPTRVITLDPRLHRTSRSVVLLFSTINQVTTEQAIPAEPAQEEASDLREE